MKTIACPLNGIRNSAEFVYGGPVKTMPNPKACSDAEWARHVFYGPSEPEIIQEWWLHAPSSYWFIAERCNGSDTILRTYDPSECFTHRVDVVGEPDNP